MFADARRPLLLAADDGFRPLQVGLAALPGLDEILAWHLGGIHSKFQHRGFVAADFADHFAQTAEQGVGLHQRELQAQHFIGNGQTQLLRPAIFQTIFVDGFMEFGGQVGQQLHAARHFQRIGTGFDHGGFTVGVVVHFRRFHRRRQFRLIAFQIEEADDHFRQTLAAGLVFFVIGQDLLGDPREIGQAGVQLVQAFFDALGDDDFAFAGQQIDRTHFAHVHAYRIGGAAGFVLKRGQHGHGFFGGDHVDAAADAAAREQERFDVRGRFVHHDAHVVDHADDVFHLIGIDQVFRQMVVDVGQGQVALIHALGDEFLDFRFDIAWGGHMRSSGQG